jgi:hypothetical protein
MRKFLLTLSLFFLFISPVLAEEPLLSIKASYSTVKAFNDRVEIYRESSIFAHGTPGLKTIYYNDILEADYSDYSDTCGHGYANKLKFKALGMNYDNRYDYEVNATSKQAYLISKDKVNNEFVYFIDFVKRRIIENNYVKPLVNQEIRVVGKWNIEENDTKNKDVILNSDVVKVLNMVDAGTCVDCNLRKAPEGIKVGFLNSYTDIKFIGLYKEKKYIFPLGILSCNKYVEYKPYNWSNIIWNSIRQQKIFLGMTKDMAILSWGNPDSINRTVGTWGVHEQWVYGDNVYLYFENGKITSWQD